MAALSEGEEPPDPPEPRPSSFDPVPVDPVPVPGRRPVDPSSRSSRSSGVDERARSCLFISQSLGQRAFGRRHRVLRGCDGLLICRDRLQSRGAPAFLRPGRRGRRRRRVSSWSCRGSSDPRIRPGEPPGDEPVGGGARTRSRPRARPRARARQPAGGLRLGQVCRLLLLVGRRRGLVAHQSALILGDLTRTAPGNRTCRRSMTCPCSPVPSWWSSWRRREAVEAEVSLSSSSVSCASSAATVDSAEDTASASDVVSSVASDSPAVTCCPTVAVTVATWPGNLERGRRVAHRLDRTDHILGLVDRRARVTVAIR